MYFFHVLVLIKRVTEDSHLSLDSDWLQRVIRQKLRVVLYLPAFFSIREVNFYNQTAKTYTVIC